MAPVKKPDGRDTRDDQVGATLDRVPDQLGGRRHAGHDALDLHRSLDLETVGSEVVEPIDLERSVEVPDDLTQVHRHRPIVIQSASPVNPADRLPC